MRNHQVVSGKEGPLKILSAIVLVRIQVHRFAAVRNILLLGQAVVENLKKNLQLHPYKVQLT